MDHALIALPGWIVKIISDVKLANVLTHHVRMVSMDLVHHAVVVQGIALLPNYVMHPKKHV